LGFSYLKVQDFIGLGDNSDDSLEEDTGVLVINLVKGGQSTTLQLIAVLSTLLPTGLGEGRADYRWIKISNN